MLTSQVAPGVSEVEHKTSCRTPFAPLCPESCVYLILSHQALLLNGDLEVPLDVEARAQLLFQLCPAHTLARQSRDVCRVVVLPLSDFESCLLSDLPTGYSTRHGPPFCWVMDGAV